MIDLALPVCLDDFQKLQHFLAWNEAIYFDVVLVTMKMEISRNFSGNVDFNEHGHFNAKNVNENLKMCKQAL